MYNAVIYCPLCAVHWISRRTWSLSLDGNLCPWSLSPYTPSLRTTILFSACMVFHSWFFYLTEDMSPLSSCAWFILLNIMPWSSTIDVTNDKMSVFRHCLVSAVLCNLPSVLILELQATSPCQRCAVCAGQWWLQAWGYLSCLFKIFM